MNNKNVNKKTMIVYGLMLLATIVLTVLSAVVAYGY